MTDIFDTAKDLNMREIAEFYGVGIDRHGKGLCPFHSEKSPSFVAYPDGRGYYCYGCGEGGDAVNFVSKLLNLTPIESLKRLNADFKLGLDFDSPIDTEAVNKHRAEIKLVKDFDEWEREAFKTICRYNHILNEAKETLKPESPEHEPCEAWAFSLHELSRIEYWLDILTFGNFKDKTDFYNLHSEEVSIIAERVHSR